MKKINLLFLALLTLPLHAQESADVKVNFQKNVQYLTTIKTIFHNSTMKDRTDYQKLTVKEVTSDNALVEIAIDKIVINLSNNGKPLKYDSSQNESEMSIDIKGLHSRFKPTLNTVISETISKTGVSSNRKKVSGQLNAQMATQKTHFIKLPSEPLVVDLVWTQLVQSDKIKVLFSYMVTEITETKIVLECIGEPQGMLKGKIEGFIELDKKSGIPTKKEYTSDMTLNGQVIQTTTTIITKKVQP